MPTGILTSISYLACNFLKSLRWVGSGVVWLTLVSGFGPKLTKWLNNHFKQFYIIRINWGYVRITNLFIFYFLTRIDFETDLSNIFVFVFRSEYFQNYWNLFPDFHFQTNKLFPENMQFGFHGQIKVCLTKCWLKFEENLPRTNKNFSHI